MAAKKKSGQTYIRMGPDVHTRVAKVAKALDMDINGLLNLCVRINLPQYELLVMADETGDLRKKATVLHFIHALTQFSASLMAQTEFVALGLTNPVGKKAIEDLIDVMYEFAIKVRDTEQLFRKTKSAPAGESSTEGQQSTQPQEGS